MALEKSNMVRGLPEYELLAEPGSTQQSNPTQRVRDIELWRSVLLHYLHQGHTATKAISAANECVQALCDRFPTRNETESHP